MHLKLLRLKKLVAIFSSIVESASDWDFLILVLTLYLFLTLSLFLQWPPPMADEEMFGDVARTFGQQGHLTSELVPGMGRGMFWQPPLYFLVLAPVVRLFGFSLVVLRAFSAVVGALIVVATYLLGKKSGSTPCAKVGSLLLVCNPHFVTYVKYGRMDGLCVLFILLSFLLAVVALKREKPGTLLLSGIAGSAAVITHPLGLIAPVSIVLWLLMEKEARKGSIVKSVIWFLAPMLVVLVLWLLYILSDPGAFITQMAYQLAHKQRGWHGVFLGFFNRYRFLPLVLLTNLLATVTLWWRWSRSAPRKPAQLLIAIASVVSITAIGTRFELPYQVYWVPVASIAVGMAVVGLSGRWTGGLRVLALGSVLNGLALFGYVNYSIHWKERAQPDYQHFVQSVASVLPPSCTVMNVGYPSIFWGLREARPEIRYCERIYFDSSTTREVITSLDYFIFTRDFAPAEDAVLLDLELRELDSLSARFGRRLELVGEVGEERRFVASAKIYRIRDAKESPDNPRH